MEFTEYEWQNEAANASEWSFGGKLQMDVGTDKQRPLFLHKGLACVFVLCVGKNSGFE
jgi:hypothetical protein